MGNQNHQALATQSQALTDLARVSKLLKNNTESVTIADLLGGPVTSFDVKECLLALEQNYGKQYSEEFEGRVQLLFSKCLEKHWSARRFRDTVNWIIENRPYANWTIADFLTAPLAKLHGYAWYAEQVGKKLKCKQYRIGEHIRYALADEEIPLPEYIPEPARYDAPEPETVSDARREEILAELKQRASVTKEKYSMTTPLGKIAEELGE